MISWGQFDARADYLFDNADAEAVVFHASFADTVEAIRGQLPKVKLWIAVAQPGDTIPAWAEDYEAIASQPGPRALPPQGRSGDDMLFLYTGGTTGMPKGVMWRLDDLFQVLAAEAGERALMVERGESRGA